MSRLLWRAPLWLALVEGWLAAAVCLLLSLSITADAPGLVISMLFVIFSAVGGSVAAFRARLTPARWMHVAWVEAAASAGFAVGLIVVMLALLAALGLTDLPTRSDMGALGCYFFLGLSAPGFLFLRGLSWIYLYWDRLRRRRFAWALTDALLRAIVGVGVFGLVVGALAMMSFTPDIFADLTPGAIVSRIVIWTFMLLLVSILFALGSLAAFLPFAALFSYWTARRMTRRLEHLSRATTSLQDGDLSQRVPVEGEDEVALLQAHFNSMAENLQRSTQDLQAERDKVAALLQNQRELTAAISHELRTPVAVIQGYSDALRQHWEDAPAADLRANLDVIAQEGQRLQALLNDLLSLSQAEAGRLSLTIERMDAGALLQQVAQLFAPLAWEQQKVEVVAEVGPDPLFIRADALRLEQILTNLLYNALRHTPPGGVVVASAAQRGSIVRLEVADTGEGILVEDLPYIWDRFYQSGDPQRRTPAGAGLGLALVKELSEAMQAQVGVESTPGEGSTFWVEFPLDLTP